MVNAITLRRCSSQREVTAAPEAELRSARIEWRAQWETLKPQLGSKSGMVTARPGLLEPVLRTRTAASLTPVWPSVSKPSMVEMKPNMDPFYRPLLF